MLCTVIDNHIIVTAKISFGNMSSLFGILHNVDSTVNFSLCQVQLLDGFQEINAANFIPHTSQPSILLTTKLSCVLLYAHQLKGDLLPNTTSM